MTKAENHIQEFKFNSFNETKIDPKIVVPYEFKSINSSELKNLKNDFQKIIKEERTYAKSNQFKINPIVEVHRGLKDQEEREDQEQFNLEVERKIAEVQDEAFKIGFDEGVNQGREEIFNEMRSVVDQKLDYLGEMVTDVLKTHNELINNQKREIYQLIKNLTKWIILRELKEDGKYIERLIEKLLLETQSRNNLLVQVNANDFNQMEEVLTHIEEKLGKLSNVRVEIDNAIVSKGMIIESENGIVNATIEEQFKTLDKIFEDVISEKIEG